MHIFAEARIFNYKSHFAFFFQFTLLVHHPNPPTLRTVNKTFLLYGNKWSFFFPHRRLLHSEAHISMSCYISIAIYLNRLKKPFIFLCLGKMCCPQSERGGEVDCHHPEFGMFCHHPEREEKKSFHSQFISPPSPIRVSSRIQSFRSFMYISNISPFSSSPPPHSARNPYIERKAPP